MQFDHSIKCILHFDACIPTYPYILSLKQSELTGGNTNMLDFVCLMTYLSNLSECEKMLYLCPGLWMLVMLRKASLSAPKKRSIRLRLKR